MKVIKVFLNKTVFLLFYIKICIHMPKGIDYDKMEPLFQFANYVKF